MKIGLVKIQDLLLENAYNVCRNKTFFCYLLEKELQRGGEKDFFFYTEQLFGSI